MPDRAAVAFGAALALRRVSPQGSASGRRRTMACRTPAPCARAACACSSTGVRPAAPGPRPPRPRGPFRESRRGRRASPEAPPRRRRCLSMRRMVCSSTAPTSLVSALLPPGRSGRRAPARRRTRSPAGDSLGPGHRWSGAGCLRRPGAAGGGTSRVESTTRRPAPSGPCRFSPRERREEAGHRERAEPARAGGAAARPRSRAGGDRGAARDLAGERRSRRSRHFDRTPDTRGRAPAAEPGPGEPPGERVAPAAGSWRRWAAWSGAATASASAAAS
jgi:hypothetical protein